MRPGECVNTPRPWSETWMRGADLKKSTTHKHCPRCDQDKLLDEFSRNSTSLDGRSGYCRICMAGYMSTRRANMSERDRKQEVIKRKEKNPNWHRPYVLKKYGMTPQDYDDLLLRQGGGCGICGALPPPLPRHLDIDHCHETNRVRGLLCNTCNRGIGHLGDNAAGVRKALEYLTCA